MADSQDRLPHLGLLSKTITECPTIRWILPFYHGNECNLFVVGEHFVQLHTLGEDGTLSQLASRADLGSKILSASTIQAAGELSADDRNHVKTEIATSERHVEFLTQPLGPQQLVVALEEGSLLFISLYTDAASRVSLRTSHVVLPRFADRLQTLGRYLAVDPLSRALAVASSETVLLTIDPLYKTEVTVEGSAVVRPASQELLAVSGSILAISFMQPPENDPDRLLLLLLLSKGNKIILQQVDRRVDDLANAQHQPSTTQRISQVNNQIPSAIVPLQPDKFLIIWETEVTLHTNLLSGHSEQSTVNIQTIPASTSHHTSPPPRVPPWATWARGAPYYGQHEAVHLARADGVVFRFDNVQGGPMEEVIGRHRATCLSPIDQALALCRLPDGREVLIAGGDRGSGVIMLGMDAALDPASRTIMDLHEEEKPLVMWQPIGNWSPNIDMISSPLPHAREPAPRVNDGLFATSGGQPHGRICELRYGLDARVGASVANEEVFRGSTQVWAMSIADSQELVLLLAKGAVTEAVSFDTDMAVQFLGSQDTGFELDKRTLAAATLLNDFQIQITPDEVLAYKGQTKTSVVLPDAIRTLTAADIESDKSTIALSGRLQEENLEGGSSKTHTIQYRRLVKGADNTITLEPYDEAKAQQYDTHATAVKLTKTSTGLLSAFTLLDSTVRIHAIDMSDGESAPSVEKELSVRLHDEQLSELDMSFTCESLAWLGGETSKGDLVQHFSLLCGLRSGSIRILLVSYSSRGGEDMLTSATLQQFSLGTMPVTLAPYSDRTLECKVIAACGPAACLISCDPAAARSEVCYVWITTAEDNAFQQGPVSAAVQIPAADHLDAIGLAGSLAFINDDSCLISVLDDQRKLVPRSLELPGDPRRLLYSSRLSCFVTASVMVNEASSPANGTHANAGRRSYHGVVTFRAATGDGWSIDYNLHTGETVYGLMEWAYQKPGQSRTYVFVLIATGRVRADGRRTGYIHSVQPIIRNKRVVQVTAAKTWKFDSPVYALAPYGDLAYVASAGSWLQLIEFQPDVSKWITRTRYKLHSEGVHISSNPPQLFVTTAKDSLVVLSVSTRDDQVVIRPIGFDSGSYTGMHHITIEVERSKQNIPDQMDLDEPNAIGASATSHSALALTTTKACQVRGLLTPSAQSVTTAKTMPLAFSAQLPRSITRLVHSPSSRPTWKSDPPDGMLVHSLFGMSVDGTMTGFAILDDTLTAQLKWVQSLCERSVDICPVRARRNTFPWIVDQSMSRIAALCRRAFGADGNDDDGVEMQVMAPADRHIDGDVLCRLLEHPDGAVETLRRILLHEAEREGAVGENLEWELSLVDDAVRLVERAVDQWF